MTKSYAPQILTDIGALADSLYAALSPGKTAPFVDMLNGGGLFWSPSLSFCTHEGLLYQLYSTTALPGYDPTIERKESDDPRKLWVRIKEL
jgi:hypothetical protein